MAGGQPIRVLVVEDEFFIAGMLAELLEGLGCEVVGPVPHAQEALELIEHTSALAGAVLDVSLCGETSAAVAQRLSEVGVPFVFLTGHDDLSSLPPAWRDAPCLTKPFHGHQLADATRRFRALA